MPTIFVSYRREDAPGYAGRLCDRLQEEFGRQNVFFDVDNLQPGDDFVDAIRQRLNGCDLMLVVIGRRWLTATNAQGARRLEQTTDYVRLEVETALERRIMTVPVLVEGAVMPPPEELPTQLRALSRRQAIELSDTRWAFDIARLMTNIGRATPFRRPPWRSRRIQAAAVLAVATIGLWFWGRPVNDLTPLSLPPSPIRIPAITARPFTPVEPTVHLGQQPGAASAPVAEKTSKPAVQSVSRHPAVPDAAAPVPKEPAVAPAPSRADELSMTARRHLYAGEMSEALANVAEGMKLDPAHSGLRQVWDELLRDAQSRMNRAKREAIEAGATVTMPAYGQALRAEDELAGLNAANARETVISKYAAVTRQFAAAADEARQLASPRTHRDDVAGVAERNASGTAGAKPPTETKEAPRTEPNVTEQRSADEAAIREVLRKYADAYKALNVAAVKAVYPTAPAQLQSRFSQYRSYDMQIVDHQIKVDGNQATVTCTTKTRVTLKAGGTTPQQEAATTFHLEKAGSSWLITARDVR